MLNQLKYKMIFQSVKITKSLHYLQCLIKNYNKINHFNINKAQIKNN